MSIAGFIFFGLFLILTVYLIVIYNRLVSLKHNTSKALSNIDVLLKQRHEELPKLVATCKQYMKYEAETLEKIMQARNGVAKAMANLDMSALGGAETQLRQGLTHLFAVAEAYPDLKTNESFRHLQSRITGLENAIADRREFYNESVNNNNVRIEQFPDILVARRLNFKPFTLLEFTEKEIADVNIGALFN